MKSIITFFGVILVIILMCAAYYIGVNHVLAPGTHTSTTTSAVSVASSSPSSRSSATSANTGTTVTTVITTNTNTSSWKTDTETAAHFSIQYPSNLTASHPNASGSESGWRLDSQDPGTLVTSIDVPASTQPKTNLGDSKLTIGYSTNAAAVAACYTPTPSGSTTPAPTKKTINGVIFTVFTSNDAGAGNLYNTTSYRTVHNGACYAVEYTVHSTQLANYPASLGISQFNNAQITSLFEGMVGTFVFLP